MLLISCSGGRCQQSANCFGNLRTSCGLLGSGVLLAAKMLACVLVPSLVALQMHDEMTTVQRSPTINHLYSDSDAADRGSIVQAFGVGARTSAHEARVVSNKQVLVPSALGSCGPAAWHAVAHDSPAVLLPL